MKVIIEWFGETGALQGSRVLDVVAPTLVQDVRNLVGAQFRVTGNPHAAALVSIIEVEPDELMRLPEALKIGGRFLVTNMTQGNWGNGGAF